MKNEERKDEEKDDGNHGNLTLTMGMPRGEQHMCIEHILDYSKVTLIASWLHYWGGHKAKFNCRIKAS